MLHILEHVFPKFFGTMSANPTFLIQGIEHHKLQSTWTFSYCIPPRSSQNQAAQWEHYLHPFTDFESFEDFYGILNTVEKPSTLPVGCRYYVFRKGIKPIWEDKANEDGYSFSVQYETNSKSKGKGKSKDKSDIAEEKWMDLTLSILTENLPNVEKINGVEFFHRKSVFRVAVWTRRLDATEKSSLEKTIKQILGPNSPVLSTINFSDTYVQKSATHEQKEEKEPKEQK